PAIQDAGIKTWVNGAFTFSPDGNPLVGPVPGKRGYWSACAVMAGFLQGGGVGKTLAEWMIEGEPEADAWSMDVARYGKYAENRQYIRETTGQFYSRRFVMTYPNEQLPAGRPYKMAPAHDAMTEAGCKWGVSWDLETPLYFADTDFEETPTLKRSNAFDIVGDECRNVRSNVGMVDITGFSRFEVSGPKAEAWLDNLLSTKLPAPGRARLAVMLSPEGRLKGDLTLLNWGDGTYWIMGSYYLRRWHMRWFMDHMSDGVSLRDLGEEIAGFALTGPNARKVLQNVVHDDLGDFPFMGCRKLDVGMVPGHVARMSVAGELGFEVSCRMGDHVRLRRTLLEAGEEFGLREYGFNAMLSMRLEKSFGIWSAEFTQDRTPGMTGMDRWIAWDKGDFIGRDAAIAERDGNGPARKLVTLEVDSEDADASGYEPVWNDGTLVGFVTSGGYGHTLKKSLAMAMVDTDLSEPGQALSVHVVGRECAARVIPPSPYDPDGQAMRG
ncbi:MAG: glycine cleavage T C-terminal barrel domain-containing protein, partial [Pseudomonadota bacterium]